MEEKITMENTNNKIIELEQRIQELETKFNSLFSTSKFSLDLKNNIINAGFINCGPEQESPILMNGTCNISISSPCTITTINPEFHNLFAGQKIQFTTSGALPTGLSTGTDYYVLSTGMTRTSFRVSATLNGSAINTSGTQSGQHTYDDPYNVWELNATKYAIIEGRQSNLRYYLPLYTIGQF